MTHTSADSGNAMTIESYDPVGRIDYLWQCTPYNCAGGVLWDMHYTYYFDGSIDTYVHPAGYYIGYSVENDGRIRAINSGLADGTHPAQVAAILYAPQGAVSKMVNGCAGTGCNSIEEFDDYNNRLERVRSRLEDYGNSAAITCEVYNYYGNVANPTTCTIPSQGTGDDGNVLGQFYQDSVNASLSHTASLAYDPTHRLTSAAATGNSTYNLTFSYDQFGNMTCQVNKQTQGYCPPYSFSSSTNRITNSGYTYDASGDLTNDGTHSYQYDAEGRLVSVDNGTTASYVYNALGERVEEDAGGTYSEYVFGKDGNPRGVNNRSTWVDTWVDFGGQHIAHFENGETYFVHSGRLGTAGIVTDYTGAVIQDELHYPWGQEWTMAGTMTEERFASLNHRDAATNLDPTHFRMYSSDQGRWLTPDPAQADIYNPQSMSRYAYSDANPTNRIDPKGLWPEVGKGGCGYNNVGSMYVVDYAEYSDAVPNELADCGGGSPDSSALDGGELQPSGSDMGTLAAGFATVEAYGDDLWIPGALVETGAAVVVAGGAAEVAACTLGGPLGCVAAAIPAATTMAGGAFLVYEGYQYGKNVTIPDFKRIF